MDIPHELVLVCIGSGSAGQQVVVQADKLGRRVCVIETHRVTGKKLVQRPLICQSVRLTSLPNSSKDFKGRHFNHEIILLRVRWYVTYQLSYRDLVGMLEEFRIALAHARILRWVQRYISVFKKRWRKTHRMVGTSWCIDETYLKVKGKWIYLYRAVAQPGNTVDFLLNTNPD